MNQFSRIELLLGRASIDKLQSSSVAVFGLGGVGSYAAEALVRGGVGDITVIDNDKVCLTNINRQLIATHKTIGEDKTAAMRDRILEINPKANVNAVSLFYDKESAERFDLTRFSYIIDAIDTVSSKLILIQKAKSTNIPIISCMGAGNKLDPTAFEIADIYSTSVCPLAKVMRKELRVRGIDSLKVVYSKEPPLTPVAEDCVSTARRQIPGSVSFVPPAAGLILAGEVIKDLVFG